MREYKDHECIINLRDIDITIDVQSEQKWQNFLQNYHVEINRFGGLKILIDDTEVDVWRIENTWHIEKEKL